MKCSNVLLRGGQAGKAAAQIYIPTNPHKLANFSVRPRFLLNSVSSAQGEPMLSERQVGSSRTKANIKQNVNGNAITLNARLPIMANSMTASFFPVEDMNSAQKNTLALPEPPAVSRLEFSFNDSTNSYISYELRDKNSILQRAVQSLNPMDETNAVSLDMIKSGDMYMIGLGWESFIDLSRQKFSLLLNSGIGSSATDYTLYSYFHGILEM